MPTPVMTPLTLIFPVPCDEFIVCELIVLWAVVHAVDDAIGRDLCDRVWKIVIEWVKTAHLSNQIEYEYWMQLPNTTMAAIPCECVHSRCARTRVTQRIHIISYK